MPSLSLALSFIQTHWIDVVLALVLVWFVVGGYRRGLIQTLGQALGAIIGFWLAREWSGWLADKLMPFLPGQLGWLHFAAFIFIFLFVDRLTGFVFWLLDKGLKILTILPFLSTIQAGLGAILGAIEGLLLIGSSSYLILTLRLDPTLLAWIQRSVIATFSQSIFYRVLGVLI